MPAQCLFQILDNAPSRAAREAIASARLVTMLSGSESSQHRIGEFEAAKLSRQGIDTAIFWAAIELINRNLL